MRPPVYRDVRAVDEHVGRPAGSSQHGRRAHFAAHPDGFAVGPRGIEVHIGMRVDEVDARYRPLDLDFASPIEATETMVGRCRTGEHERCKRCGNDSGHSCLPPARGGLASADKAD